MSERILASGKNGAKPMGRFSVDVDVANHLDVMQAREKKLAAGKVRRLTIPAVVDPGAARLVLPAVAAKQLGLQVMGKTKVKYADGRRRMRDEADGAYVTILGRSGAFTAIVEPDRDTALIGAIVLEDLDFLVDCRNQRLVPRDPHFVVSEVE